MSLYEKTQLFNNSIGKQFKVGPLKNTIRDVIVYPNGDVMVSGDYGAFNIIVCDLVEEEQLELWFLYDKLVDAATSIGYAEDTARDMVRKRFKITQVS